MIHETVRHMKRVAVIDYGIGNLLSVQRAFERIGCEIRLITAGPEIWKADYLVLPGVGAFGDAMLELNKRDLVQPIKAYCGQNRPFLGICLGMQLMLDASEESKDVQGLGIIAGSVTKLSAYMEDDLKYKVPNIGWYGLKTKKSQADILEGITDDDRFYFVHSYGVHPMDSNVSAADLQYGNNFFSAVIRKGNCCGTQFHPEKSGECGLKLLKNFVNI